MDTISTRLKIAVCPILRPLCFSSAIKKREAIKDARITEFGDSVAIENIISEAIIIVVLIHLEAG